MLDKQGQPFTTSLTQFSDHVPGHEHEARIGVPIQVGAFENQVLAVVDTAAHWCVVDKQIAEAAGFDLSDGEKDTLSTRRGPIQGTIVRDYITLLADQGDSLRVEATIFVPDGDCWEGQPSFLGYQGFLERVRFAVSPISNEFYFGPDPASEE